MRGCHTSGVHVLLWYMKGRVPPTCHYILTTALLLCWPDCCGLHAALLSHHPSRQALMSELKGGTFLLHFNTFTSTTLTVPTRGFALGHTHKRHSDDLGNDSATWQRAVHTPAGCSTNGGARTTHPRGAKDKKTRGFVANFVANFPPLIHNNGPCDLQVWQLPLSGGLALSVSAPRECSQRQTR